jgi:hypothetical protein
MIHPVRRMPRIIRGNGTRHFLKSDPRQLCAKQVAASVKQQVLNRRVGQPLLSNGGLSNAGNTSEPCWS